VRAPLAVQVPWHGPLTWPSWLTRQLSALEVFAKLFSAPGSRASLRRVLAACDSPSRWRGCQWCFTAQVPFGNWPRGPLAVTRPPVSLSGGQPASLSTARTQQRRRGGALGRVRCQAPRWAGGGRCRPGWDCLRPGLFKLPAYGEMTLAHLRQWRLLKLGPAPALSASRATRLRTASVGRASLPVGTGI
jgi:hypothetical protein